MGCMEWMQLQKKKQGQTNFFEIHLTLLHIFYVLFHSDTWMSLGGTRTSILFKLAKFGLMQVILMWLSILFCIDNLYFFHTLFFVSHIFSTNPVPLHFFIIVCSSGGLQVSFTTHRIIFCRFACPPMEIIIYIQYFCKKKFCGTNRQYQSHANSFSCLFFNKYGVIQSQNCIILMRFLILILQNYCIQNRM